MSVIREYRDAGATVLRIAVLARNTGAVALYESFGFEHRLHELTKRFRHEATDVRADER